MWYQVGAFALWDMRRWCARSFRKKQLRFRWIFKQCWQAGFGLNFYPSPPRMVHGSAPVPGCLWTWRWRRRLTVASFSSFRVAWPWKFQKTGGFVANMRRQSRLVLRLVLDFDNALYQRRTAARQEKQRLPILYKVNWVFLLCLLVRCCRSVYRIGDICWPGGLRSFVNFGLGCFVLTSEQSRAARMRDSYKAAQRFLIARWLQRWYYVRE